MEYRETVKISREEAALINDLLSLNGEQIYQKYGYKRDETITKTVCFPNGMQADIKLVICEEDTPYTEAVLFDNRGDECNYTEPGEDYLGTWELEYGGIKYVISIEEE